VWNEAEFLEIHYRFINTLFQFALSTFNPQGPATRLGPMPTSSKDHGGLQLLRRHLHLLQPPHASTSSSFPACVSPPPRCHPLVLTDLDSCRVVPNKSSSLPLVSLFSTSHATELKGHQRRQPAGVERLWWDGRRPINGRACGVVFPCYYYCLLGRRIHGPSCPALPIASCVMVVVRVVDSGVEAKSRSQIQRER
jgi:hypothetical protein